MLFLLKECVSFKISNQCDTSVSITHTKRKRMFFFSTSNDIFGADL